MLVQHPDELYEAVGVSRATLYRYLKPDGTIWERYPGLTCRPQDYRKEMEQVASGGWDEKVTVVLHHVPEDEGFEGGFEAVTPTGVPHGVSITGNDRDSSEGALHHLLDGLRAFGFDGRVAVEDATGAGRVGRYEVGTG